ncbi:MAG: putative bifunctional diguanylate cyclase/phosphodiesterase [Burkholderiales bacterium]
MNIGSSIGRTKVARRILLLFVIGALLPVSTAGLIVHFKIRDAFIDERTRHIAQIAASHVATINDRLALAAGLLASRVVADPDRVDENHVIDPYFRAVHSIGLSQDSTSHGLHGAARWLALLDQDAIAQLANGQAVLRVDASSGATPAILLLRQRTHSQAPGSIIVAEIRPEYLWPSIDDMLEGTRLCVVDSSHVVLHCSGPATALAMNKIRNDIAKTGERRLAWNEGEEAMLGSARELFLNASFHAKHWTVVAGQSAEQVLAPVASTSRDLILVMLVGIAIAVLLGLIHVRRTLTPLATLTNAIRRIGARDFTASVQVDGYDEFGELARSFNAMSRQLGQQFDTLEVLGEVDRALLSRKDLDGSVRMVLSRIHEITRCDHALAFLMEEKSGSAFRKYGDSRRSENDEILVIPEHVTHMFASGHSYISLPATASNIVTEPIHAMGGVQAVVSPIKVGDTLRGLIALGYQTPHEISSDNEELLARLGDRLAVILNADERERALFSSAHFDALTGLFNRRSFLEQIGSAFTATTDTVKPFAIFLIDLDGFANVNDAHGLECGDALLREATTRIRLSMRGSSVLARHGGDEFAIAVPNVFESNEAATIARRLIEALSVPYDLAHRQVFVTACVGIALFPTDERDPLTLMKCVEMAANRAKRLGRGQFAFFEEAMNRDAIERTTLENELRAAIEGNQLTLYFQPQLELASNRICGAEALVRWKHPVRGMVSPAMFIPIVEELGLLPAIGAWVLRSACAQMQCWRAAGVMIDHISVNVSPKQLVEPGFADLVVETLRRFDLLTSSVHLEVTESVLVDNTGAAEEALARLASLGFTIELDDFGTGYSSLAYLRRLPVAVVKMDRMFLFRIESDESAAALARAAVDMVRALRKRVIFEGVETIEQLDMLRSWNCDVIQGFYFSKPMPAAEFGKFFTERIAAEVPAGRPVRAPAEAIH